MCRNKEQKRHITMEWNKHGIKFEAKGDHEFQSYVWKQLHKMRIDKNLIS